MATSVPLGIVSLKAEGAYAADKLYKKGMWVTSSGSSYAYINPTPAAGVPLTDTSHWQQIASVGGQDILDAVTAEKNAAIAAKVLAEGYAAQLAAGIASPAGTYADLAALIAADPDHSKIYITLDDGKWCYWSGSAWTAGGVYQTLMGVDDTLSKSGEAADAETTGLALDGVASDLSNLSPYVEGSFPFDVGWEHGEMNVSTGVEISSTTAVRTSYFLLRTGETLVFRGEWDMAGMYVIRFDLGKAYVGMSGGYTTRYTAPQDEYVRLVSRYEPRREIIDIIGEFGETLWIIRKKANVNLSDYVFKGRYPLNHWRIGGVFVAHGGLGKDPNRANTDLFHVSKGIKIVSTLDPAVYAGIALIWYSASTGEFIRSTGASYSSEYVADADYQMRLVTKYITEENIVSLAELQNKVYLVPPSADSVVENNAVVGDLQTLYKSEPITGMEAGQTITLASRTHADLYALYDALMAAHPNTISKRLLGHGTGTNGLVDNSLPIYEYVFAPPSTTRNLQDHTKKLLLVTGVHGEEKVSCWGTYEFIRQMYAQHGDSVMQTIAANIRFVTIPCLNPGGFDLNSRYNKNMVDINRNFSHLWADNTSQYKGTARYSEQESQIMRDWLLEHKEGAFAFIDYHNTGEAYGSAYLNTTDASLLKPYSYLMRRLSVYWNGKFARTGNEAYGWTAADNIPVTFREASHVGIGLSAILEIAFNYNGVRNTSETLERAVEMLAGYLQLLLSMA